MVVRVAARIQVVDRAELLIGTQVESESGLFDAAGEVARAILREIGLGGGGIDESRCERARGDDRDGLPLGATGTIWLAAAGNILLHDPERRQNPIGIDLIDVV